MKSVLDNLLVRFSIVSLVVLATVAVTIVVFVSDRLENDAIDEVIEHAVYDTSVMAVGALEPADFEGPMSGKRLNEFDRWVRSTLLTDITAKVKVWSANGTLIYSSDPRDIEEHADLDVELPAALSGKVAAHIELANEASPGSPRGHDLIEVYAPVVFPGTTEMVGATEIYQYHAPIARRTNEMRAWVFLITGLGFVALYGVLVTVVWGASHTISRQQSALVEANLELESRVEARSVENARLYRELQASTEEKAVVDEVARIVTSTLDIDQVHEKFAAEVKKLMDFDRMTISVIDHEASTFSGKYISGVQTEGRKVGAAVPLEGSGVERMLRTGRPVLRQDIRIGESLSGDHARLRVGLHASLSVPLFTKSRITGTLTVHSHQVGAFGPREQAILERLADQIAPAVENARMHAELIREAQDREVLAEIGRIISSSLDIDQVFERFSGQVHKLIPFDRIVVNVVDFERQTVTNVYVGGVSVTRRGAGYTRLLEGTQVEAVARSKTSLLVQPKDRDELVSRFPELGGSYDAGMRSFLSVPLVSGDRIIAVLNLRSTIPGAFSDQHLTLAESVASQIAGAIANAQLYARRLEAEELVRESEERFRSVVETTPEAVISIDSDGNIIAWNPAARGMFGYEDGEALGKSITMVIPESYRSDHQAGMERLRAGHEPQLIGQALELNALRRDGTEFPVELSLAAWETHAGKFYTGILRDITMRKRLQEQLVQSQKMEVVGQLAGGVAHDFNNLLTPIMGYSALGIDELASDHPVRGYLQQVLRSAERGAELVRQLLGFARRQVVQPRVLNLNDHVINTEKMLCRLIGEDIELVCRLELELGLVKADAGQIEQVLVNLSVNARDAMPGGGKLTIATANVDLDAGSIPKSVGLIPGPYVKISVGDTGAGMSEEVRSHLFEPFFTTKGVGEGTGLGLATCYGIVKQSGGEIRVQSAPEQGTTFEIYLPRVGGTAPPVAEAGEPEELSKGMETVLLVEDEPAVRSLAALALRRQGYTVLEAANGQEALQVAQDRNGNEIDLLLTDVVMPRMGGRELADRLCPLMPRMRVLLSSGFPDQAPAPGEKWDAGIAFMPKPFTPAVLAEKVREVLDTPSPGA